MSWQEVAVKLKQLRQKQQQPYKVCASVEVGDA